MMSVDPPAEKSKYPADRPRPIVLRRGATDRQDSEEKDEETGGTGAEPPIVLDAARRPSKGERKKRGRGACKDSGVRHSRVGKERNIAFNGGLPAVRRSA